MWSNAAGILASPDPLTRSTDHATYLTCTTHPMRGLRIASTHASSLKPETIRIQQDVHFLAQTLAAFLPPYRCIPMTLQSAEALCHASSKSRAVLTTDSSRHRILRETNLGERFCARCLSEKPSYCGAYLKDTALA